MDTTTSGTPTSTPTATDRAEFGIAGLRAVVGTVFLAHGAQKLFVFGLGGVAGAFAEMGIPLAGITGPAVALVEFSCGLALLLGLFTRIVVLPLAAVMLGALLFVHLPEGFFLPNGFEFVLTLLAALIALALAGPGALSVDAILDRRRVQA